MLQLWMQLALAYIDTRDMRCAVLKQDIGKTTCRLPYIYAPQARYLQTRGLQSAFQF
jgi:hypothetical protein